MKRFFWAAFAAGMVVLVWIAAGFAGGSWLTLAMTALIAAVYLLGAFELRQFRQATAALDQVLDATAQAPATLGEWLQQLPATLRDAVRLRVEGERGALPGPALTPYLVGLLVMLGMLGTFLGMVVTFRGTVFALERSTDLEAMRTALAAPIRGLGLSFGASVAGVAASAMLGLMAAIARRERMEVARKLEARIADALQPFSLVHQRQESFRALHVQARAIPELVEKLGVLVERIDQRGERLDASLLERQDALQRDVTAAYAKLAQDVGLSLKDSMTAGARASGDAIRPVVESAMAQVTQQAERLHARLGEVAQGQVEMVATRFSTTAQAMASTFEDAIGRAQSAQAEGDRERLQAWTAALRKSADEMQGTWQRAGELGLAQQAAITGALAKASADFTERTAASAGVIAQLREEMSRLAERDNLALQERTLLLEQLSSVLDAVNGASDRQRAATDALLASASSAMEQAGSRFAESLDAQSAKAAEAATHIAAGAVELSAVAEAFVQGVQQFQVGNDKLVEGLDRMEASLRRATTRSDEQLAYYVAQAREVIDLSIASQQGLVENLRSLQVRPIKTLPAEGARA
ncbi:MAG: hypothetical protein K0Q43_2629 [Ramlibacter sp.]|jgi:hypothetical protein|nr:hypothetical protein [Ramlibacter sp.]MDF2464394.1 hypothetical protein [Ramlibacter sp.]